jgi:hypothetical protein
MRLVGVARLPLSCHRTFSTSTITMSPALFHNFDVTSQVFFEKPNTLAIVNLKPIVPLHVLVIPRKLYPRLADLPGIDLNELFESVQTISSKIQELVQATACTISIQDGADAVSSTERRRFLLVDMRSGTGTICASSSCAHPTSQGRRLHTKRCHLLASGRVWTGPAQGPQRQAGRVRSGQRYCHGCQQG